MFPHVIQKLLLGSRRDACNTSVTQLESCFTCTVHAETLNDIISHTISITALCCICDSITYNRTERNAAVFFFGEATNAKVKNQAHLVQTPLKVGAHKRSQTH